MNIKEFPLFNDSDYSSKFSPTNISKSEDRLEVLIIHPIYKSYEFLRIPPQIFSRSSTKLDSSPALPPSFYRGIINRGQLVQTRRELSSTVCRLVCTL